MTITSIPLRRLLTIAGVCTVMILAGLSIRVAAAWTASAAPLTVAPTSISTIQAALDAEQVRSGELQAELDALEIHAASLAAALDAATARVATDRESASAVAARMTEASDRLVELDKQIARAERDLAATVAKARRRAAAAAAPAVVSTGGDDDHDDDEEEEDDD